MKSQNYISVKTHWNKQPGTVPTSRFDRLRSLRFRWSHPIRRYLTFGRCRRQCRYCPQFGHKDGIIAFERVIRPAGRTTDRPTDRAYVVVLSLNKPSKTQHHTANVEEEKKKRICQLWKVMMRYRDETRENDGIKLTAWVYILCLHTKQTDTHKHNSVD